MLAKTSTFFLVIKIMGHSKRRRSPSSSPERRRSSDRRRRETHKKCKRRHDSRGRKRKKHKRSYSSSESRSSSSSSSVRSRSGSSSDLDDINKYSRKVKKGERILSHSEVAKTERISESRNLLRNSEENYGFGNSCASSSFPHKQNDSSFGHEAKSSSDISVEARSVQEKFRCLTQNFHVNHNLHCQKEKFLVKTQTQTPRRR